VIVDSVYEGGRIGISGQDTNQRDGMLLKLKRPDLNMEWAVACYAGKGVKEVCKHHLKGIGLFGSDLLLYGQVYKRNGNNFRYCGFWFDLPGTTEAYQPEMTDMTGKTATTTMSKAVLFDGSLNAGVYEKIIPDMNLEYQNTAGKN
jgi:hypothetical protein